MSRIEPRLSGVTADRPVLLLATASTRVEQQLLREWMARQHDAGLTAGSVEVLRLPRPGSGSGQAFDELADRLAADEDRLLMPVRVGWLPPERDGGRRARMVDLISGRNPYQPGERRQARIASRQSDRVRVVAGDPATVAELRVRWQESGTGDDRREFARFVARRAVLALERADHQLLGPRYKAPRLVKEEILASARFRAGLDALAPDLDRGRPVLDDATRMLGELATGWGRVVVDLIPLWGRKVVQLGFDPELDHLPDEVERMRATMQRHAAILLWSHRSNLDGLVLTVAMHEHRLPPAHMFAGINMAFGPMGSVFRRAGVIFIRRRVDDPLYSYVLREFVGYVVEKRFNLSWSIEGTRSRTGKMLPPKLGLLSYVAEAYCAGRTDDVVLQPVSISFDQLHEITEYAAYASGADKKPEGFGWLVGFIRAQAARHYGRVYVRFPEAVSMREFLGPPNGAIATDPAARRLALQKMALEVAWRINRATPVTAPALVTTVLLGVRGVALTLDQVHGSLTDALDYLERRGVPRAASVAGLRSPGGVRATLDALSSGGPVTAVTDGREPVWNIGPGQQLAATFYRNSLIHVVLGTAIAELAVLHASSAGSERLGAFWEHAERLRDLLKFEFYFPDREAFRAQMNAEMVGHDPRWEDALTAHSDAAHPLLSRMRPLVSPTVLGPFVEAYAVVADVLVDQPAPVDRGAVVRQALAVGRQYVAQQRVRSNEPVSALLFDTALKLADNQGLLTPAPDLAARRLAFLAELRVLQRQIDEVERVAVRRFLDAAAPARG